MTPNDTALCERLRGDFIYGAEETDDQRHEAWIRITELAKYADELHALVLKNVPQLLELEDTPDWCFECEGPVAATCLTCKDCKKATTYAFHDICDGCLGRRVDGRRQSMDASATAQLGTVLTAEQRVENRRRNAKVGAKHVFVGGEMPDPTRCVDCHLRENENSRHVAELTEGERRELEGDL